MSTQRRDTDRGAGDAVERLWQTYADQIGIPGAEAAASNDALPRARDAKRQRRQPVRRIGFGTGPLLLALAVTAIVAAAGAFWRHSSTVNGTSASRSATLASAPATEIERVVEEKSPDLVWRMAFTFGDDAIEDESRQILDKVAVAMNSNPSWHVRIEGHTDALGAADYNRALSQRRAQAVKDYLEAAGIAPRRLSAVGFGATRPVAPNSADGNALNRRVELHRH